VFDDPPRLARADLAQNERRRGHALQLTQHVADGVITGQTLQSQHTPEGRRQVSVGSAGRCRCQTGPRARCVQAGRWDRTAVLRAMCHLSCVFPRWSVRDRIGRPTMSHNTGAVNLALERRCHSIAWSARRPWWSTDRAGHRADDCGASVADARDLGPRR